MPQFYIFARLQYTGIGFTKQTSRLPPEISHIHRKSLVDEALRRGADLALIDQRVQGTASDPQLACSVSFRELGHRARAPARASRPWSPAAVGAGPASAPAAGAD